MTNRPFRARDWALLCLALAVMAAAAWMNAAARSGAWRSVVAALLSALAAAAAYRAWRAARSP